MIDPTRSASQPTAKWLTDSPFRWIGSSSSQSLNKLSALLGIALMAFAAIDFRAAAQGVAEPKPDFLVRDVNPNSPRNGKAVSPRDYRLQISAFYFGAAG
jgi:hypothetical protein